MKESKKICIPKAKNGKHKQQNKWGGKEGRYKRKSRLENTKTANTKKLLLNILNFLKKTTGKVTQIKQPREA